MSERRTEPDRSREPPPKTLRPTWKVPDAVGVPEIVPVSELTLSPAGSPPADHVYEPSPPVAVAAAM